MILMKVIHPSVHPCPFIAADRNAWSLTLYNYIFTPSLSIGSDYNTVAGRGPTFVYNTDVQYGVLTAKVKAPSVGGTVTAIIFKSPSKDEIDYELIASRK